MDKNEKIECWTYKCRCGHTTHFMVGGAQDIICHNCWGYEMKYLGRKTVTEDERYDSLFPGRRTS